AAGRSAQRACERSSDWRRGAAGSPDPGPYSPVDLAHHNVEGAQDHHGIREFVADSDLAQTREVDEAWRADVVAVRIRCAVGHQIEADLAFRTFDPRVRLALWWPQDFRHFGADVTFRDRIQRLL